MKKLTLALALAALASACGGGNPVSEYIINADNQDTIVQGQNAQCNDAVLGRTVTTTDLKTDLTLSIYVQADGLTTTAELDGHVFTGKKTGSAYALTDSQSTEDTSAPTNTIRDHIISDVYTLNLTENGSFISGTGTYEHHESCAGNGCGPQETTTIDCIYSTNLRGEKLPDNGSQANVSQPGGTGPSASGNP